MTVFSDINLSQKLMKPLHCVSFIGLQSKTPAARCVDLLVRIVWSVMRCSLINFNQQHQQPNFSPKVAALLLFFLKNINIRIKQLRRKTSESFNKLSKRFHKFLYSLAVNMSQNYLELTF